MLKHPRVRQLDIRVIYLWNEAPVKSIGNSTTTPRDLETDLDVWIILMALSESVSARLRKHGFKCNVVEISIRDNGLNSITRQKRISQPTNITDEIVKAAFELFKKHYRWEHPIRSLGVRGSDLVMEDIPVQLDLFDNQEKRDKLERLDRAVDEIRRRFGYFSIQRAAMYQDKVLSHLDAGTHTVHPHSYFHGYRRLRNATTPHKYGIFCYLKTNNSSLDMV